MPDIMKFIVNEDANKDDPEGNLLDLDDWSDAIAEKLAAEEDVELTPQHRDVIHFLRQHYKEHGQMATGRALLNVLWERYAQAGGKKYLYQLFPKGPVRQASKIAGLPVPASSTDPSFGTSQ